MCCYEIQWCQIILLILQPDYRTRHLPTTLRSQPIQEPSTNPKTFTAGQSVVIRDEEWLVRQVDQQDGGYTLTCDGVSELIRGVEGKFHSLLEDDIQLLDPRETKLRVDMSPNFVDSRLYIESHLRRTVVNDEKIRIGHKAAMKREDYQLVPAQQALGQIRQRILIADSVGLGKTLEAGILVSELMARGRGRRILVVAVKSMLVQFQKEFWTRFSIPLTRLDSRAIQRIQTKIPANHNPFLHFDKSIISIDTLKGNDRYRRFLELAYWDIIIIDEAHNVAKRGTKQSQRSRLAEILADRSDSLIMLSATPHDGRADSFASLMNMLDPTAIPNHQDYAKGDYSDKGLVVRRFKKDLRASTGSTMQEADYFAVYCQASEQEEKAYSCIAQLRGISDNLQTLGVEKGFLSSPNACLESIRERQKRLKSREATDQSVGGLAKETAKLDELERVLEGVNRFECSKYQQLITQLQDKNSPLYWKPADDNRLVIFTERIATLNWLLENLFRDLPLKVGHVAIAHGGLSDIELQQTVDDFGNASKPVRLLICSDVASEGINLHFYCHRLIHFDLPWSLMTYSQRNGRIDRYGQEKKPIIAQLVNQTENELIAGDIRILDLLRKKSEEAERNIGDPALVMGKHDRDEEIKVVKQIILKGSKQVDLEASTQANKTVGESLLNMFLCKSEVETHDQPIAIERTLFPSDFDYCRTALGRANEDLDGLKIEIDNPGQTLKFKAPEELKYRYERLPTEVQPDEHDGLLLTANVARMENGIEQGRSGEDTWPQEQYLWRLSPVVDWLNDRMRILFHRNEAPLVVLDDLMDQDQDLFVVSGVFPSQRSHPIFFELVGVEFRNGEVVRVASIEDFEIWPLLRTSTLINRGGEVSAESKLHSQISLAIREAEVHLLQRHHDIGVRQIAQIDRHVDELGELQERQVGHIQRRFETSKQPEQLKRQKRDEDLYKTEQVFDRFVEWVTTTLSPSSQPAISLLGVLTGRHD